LLILGPSGGGKTFGALHLAQGITTPDKIALADSENGRALYYADRLAFDHISLPDHHPRTYMAAIDAAVAGGYEALVLDSLTHAWQNILGRKDVYDAAHPKEKFTSWNTFGGEWSRFVNYILFAPINIFATARSKQTYEKVEGSSKVEKMGLHPILRDGTEYEFALVFDLSQTHMARATKDNTGRFDLSPTQLWDLTSPNTSAALADWINAGELIPQPAAATMKDVSDAFVELEATGNTKVETLRSRYQAKLRNGMTEVEAREILTKLRGMMPSPTPDDEPTASSIAELSDALDALKAVSTPMLDEVSSIWNRSEKQTEGLARELVNRVNNYLAQNEVQAA
jgi:hypothetical protein